MREMKEINIDATENIIIEENIVSEDSDMTEEVQVIEEDFIEESNEDFEYSEDMNIDYGMEDEMWTDIGTETGMPEVKDPLLSSWPFVIGITSGVLIISIVLGALLAKLKIKKGIDLYED